MDIKGFQRKNNLTADGIVGKNTVKAFKEAYGWSSVEVAHFLAQADHESRGFRDTIESMNYSAQRMAEIWPTRYAADPKAIKKSPNGLARHLERNPQAIANNVYADRMGNGSEESGDGWKHRGMGYIQLTGRQQQEEFAEYIGDESVKAYPEKISSKYPLESAIYFFEKNNILRGIDKVDYANIKKVTKRVNGGYNGILDRKNKTEKYYRMAILS